MKLFFSNLFAAVVSVALIVAPVALKCFEVI